MNISYEDEYENKANTSVSFLVLPLESVVKTLTLTTEEPIVLIEDESEGAIYTTTFQAMVKDSSSIPVENLSVNLIVAYCEKACKHNQNFERASVSVIL